MAGRRIAPRMAAAQTPVLPETVTNQIQLWAKEKQRVQFDDVWLYDGFSSLAEFDAADKYARDNRVHLWSKRGTEAEV